MATATKDAKDDAAEAKAGGKKKLIIIGAAVAVVLAAAAWFFLLRGGGEEKAEEPAPEKGAVVRLDSMTLNLANGHYLKLGLALQLTADAHETPDGADAQDLAVSLFTGRTVEELSDSAHREELKAELYKEIHHEDTTHAIMGVYFTEFVTQ